MNKEQQSCFLAIMKNSTKIFAHRGYSEKYPENTMISFRKALEFGADGIETDVQMTKDGELVLVHDETVDRTSDGSGYIKDMTVQELKALDFGGWKGNEFKGEEIPLLEDLIQLVKEKNVELNIEIKNNIIRYDGIENKIIELVRKYGIEKHVILSSFNHNSLLGIMKEHNDIKCGALTYSTLISPDRYIYDNGFYSIHPMYMSLDAYALKKMRKISVPIYAYTVDIEEHMKHLQSQGVECIITNRVEAAVFTLED